MALPTSRDPETVPLNELFPERYAASKRAIALDFVILGAVIVGAVVLGAMMNLASMP